MTRKGSRPTRDDSGRLLAPDGYPVGGMATVREAKAASGLSDSKLYAMIEADEIESRRYGRSVRIPWTAVRAAFLEPRTKQLEFEFRD